MIGTCALACGVHAQSNVRPLPEAARVPDFARLSASSYTARSADGGDGAPAEPRPFFEVDLDLELAPAADLSGVSGSLATQRAGWDASVGSVTDGERTLLFRMLAEASFYDFSGTPPLVGGASDPFNDLYQTRVGGAVFSRTSAKTAWFTGLELAFGGEDDASPSDSFYMGGASGLRYSASETLDIVFGLAAQTQLSDDGWVFPYLGIDWELAEGVRLATEASELSLTVRLAEDWTWFGRADYDIRQYRLNDTGPLPGGAFRDEAILVSTGLRWGSEDSTRLELSVGAAPWRELTFIDRGGSLVSEMELEGGFFVGLGLSASL